MSHQPDEAPVVRQRVAAYAIVRSDAKLLLCRLAPRINADMWTLPGGGIDHGEHPRAAVTREVYEEAGLHVTAGRLVDVMSRHFVGTSPAGVTEDFHGIGLLFTASVDDRSRDVSPHVTEVDGTTVEAAWHGLDSLGRLTLSASARRAVSLVERGKA